MKLSARIDSLIQLGTLLNSKFGQEELENIYRLAELRNGWFSPSESAHAIQQIIAAFLSEDHLKQWASNYSIPDETASPKTIGLVLAGNIPAVGFHDILCCYVSGQKALIKYSDKDNVIIPHLLKHLAIIDPASANYFKVTDKLEGFDAVIATGSDNTARYFEHYFGKYPNIIRKNRNSIAILSGEESSDELHQLSKDIFQYYGLGCRSVSKIYLPQNYDFEQFMRIMDEYSDIMKHSKWKNNYDYNRSIYLLNKVHHWANDSLALVESPSLLSRITTLHYEQYSDLDDLKDKLEALADQIQVVVSNVDIPGLNTLGLGKSQYPELGNYADKIDTMDFLLSLS